MNYPALDPQKKQRIIDTALTLFAKQGIAASSVAQITGHAGIAKGTFYLYFSSREELEEVVIERCLDSFLRNAGQGVEDEITFRDKIRRRVHNILLWQQRYPLEKDVLRNLHRPYAAAQFETLPLARLYEEDLKLVQAGIEAGELKQLPVPLVYQLFAGAIEGLGDFFGGRQELLDDTQLVDGGLEMLTDLLCRHPRIEIKKREKEKLYEET